MSKGTHILSHKARCLLLKTGAKLVWYSKDFYSKTTQPLCLVVVWLFINFEQNKIISSVCAQTSFNSALRIWKKCSHRRRKKNFHCRECADIDWLAFSLWSRSRPADMWTIDSEIQSDTESSMIVAHIIFDVQHSDTDAADAITFNDFHAIHNERLLSSRFAHPIKAASTALFNQLAAFWIGNLTPFKWDSREPINERAWLVKHSSSSSPPLRNVRSVLKEVTIISHPLILRFSVGLCPTKEAR